jgi:ubiquinone/menaquinone biosynthesis C-methylase UbiE
MAPHLRAPYIEFERLVRGFGRPSAIVLDVGAGTGVHSFAAAGQGCSLIGADISLASLTHARARADALSVHLALLCADAEHLPIASASVDLVTTAGVLYCVDLAAFVREVQRVLKPGGSWIFVDSFDHNPVYRLNRFIGYLRGTRTRRALTNIPSEWTLEYLRQQFGEVRVSYHGIFSFLGPLMSQLVGVEAARRILDKLDHSARLFQRFAFKVVVVASEPGPR